MRRVDCAQCGVVVEQVPFGEGKNQITPAYRLYLAQWAQRLSWTETAQAFHTSWQKVYRAVAWVVAYGLAHRDLSGIRAIGIDEVQWHRGHHYLTVVYQLDAKCRRLLWVGQDRTVKSLLRFFRWLGKERSAELRFVCSDMWKPYLKVVAKRAGQALHILDRYHVVAQLNRALDEVRAKEVKRLKAAGLEPVLKRMRWCLLKKPGNLLASQCLRLAELLKMNLRTVRAYLLKESFQLFWDYSSAYWAGRYLDRWCTAALRSRIEPMKKFARTVRTHRELMLNWFRARKEFSSGIVEGFNNKLKLTLRKAYGFRTYEATEIALYHALGDLPVPKFTHTFW
jgi:transposase